MRAKPGSKKMTALSLCARALLAGSAYLPLALYFRGQIGEKLLARDPRNGLRSSSLPASILLLLALRKPRARDTTQQTVSSPRQAV
jgi:hypothetical protein